MATPFRNIGSIESSDALASMNGTGAFMDYDSANGYARVGSKGGVGVSLGTRIATVLNGVLQNAITIAANALTITLLAGSTLAAQAVTATSLTLASGTVVASAPVLAPTQTWNNGAVVFTAMKLNVTNTASAAGSLLWDLQVGGTSKFSVDKAGVVAAASNITSGANFFATGIGSGYWVNAAGSFAAGMYESSGAIKWRTNSLDQMTLSTAGSLTVAAGFTVSAGGVTVSAGGATITGSSTFTGTTLFSAGAGVRAIGVLGGSFVSFYNSSAGEAARIQALGAALSFNSATSYTFDTQLVLGALSGTPDNGSIWWDGTNYKGRIGGVTKTFTLT